jgi:hypothetical protein
MDTNIIHDWNSFFNAVLIAVIPVILGGAGFLVKQLFGFVKEKTRAVKNETIRNGLIAAEGEAERVTNMIVASLNQTIVGSLRAQNGGKISASDVARIKSEALASIKQLVSSESTTILEQHKGDIENFFAHLLEEAVGQQKFIRPVSVTPEDPVASDPVVPVTPDPVTPDSVTTPASE